MAVNPIKVWNGTAWEYTGPVVAAPPVKYQATQPSSPATGDVWVESDVDVATFDPSQIVRGGAYVNEAARSSAITSPVTGMITYVGDTGTDSPASTIPQIETYTGSAWQTPYGMTQLANVPFTTASSIAIDNVFSTTYTNYLVSWTISASSGDSDLLIYGRVAGVDKSTGLRDTRLSAQNTTIAGSIANSIRVGAVSNTYPAFCSGSFTLFNPNVAVATTYTGHSVYTSNAGVDYQFIHGGYCNVADQWDGIKVLPSGGTISGTVRIYGFRKS